MTTEEVTISNKWEMVTIVELLGQKRLLHQAGLARHHRRATQEEPLCQNP